MACNLANPCALYDMISVCPCIQEGVGRASAGMSCLALEGVSGGGEGERGAHADEGGGTDKPDKG